MAKKDWGGMQGGAGSNAVYGLGLIGALVYFIQQANTFGQILLAIIKAIVWPAILIYKLLDLLKLS